MNRHMVHDSAMNVDEARRATRIGEEMLKPDDKYLMVLEDLRGLETPWMRGNDDKFGEHLARLEFGTKLPEGEVRWQKRHGTRYAPAPAI